MKNNILKTKRRKKMDIEQQIEQLEQQMRINEIADDGYYLSLRYKEDCKNLAMLRKLSETIK